MLRREPGACGRLIGTSRALDSIARVGSAAGFIGAVGEFIGKDVAVVRATVADLGSDLGLLDDIVEAALSPDTVR